MKKKRFLTIGLLVVAICALVGRSQTAQAQGQERVPRVMIRWLQAAPLDWDSEGSVAMVVMPPQLAKDFSALDIAVPDMDVFENTLAANLPDLTAIEIAYLSDQFVSVFEPWGEGMILRNWFLTTPLTHVKTGGVERFNGPALVHWDSLPSAGATAKAGPDGDVFVLGEFGFERNTSAFYPLPTSTYVMEQGGAVDVTAQIAIGWFTK